MQQERIKVAVRIRPKNDKELDDESCVKVHGSTINIFDDKNSRTDTFNYDHIFNEESSQETVYAAIGIDSLDSILGGFNSCIFAYGQTGCFAAGTSILMYSGDHQPVERISIGDIIMGDDYTPRRVLKLFRGWEPMWRINSGAGTNYSYVVNEGHTMVFVDDRGDLFEMELRKYIQDPFECKIARWVENSNIVHDSFTIEPMGFGQYYGFMLDGNHRFIGAGGNILRNSGKSHSIMGSKDQPGLIPRICEKLFNLAADRRDMTIEVSYFEIYSEEIRDLLSSSGNKAPVGGLKVREHPVTGPYVEDLSRVLVYDYKTLRKLIDQGNRERVTAATKMNLHSSRSHAILTLYVKQLQKDESGASSGEIRSKLNLVDLAGSERVEASGVTGINFQEAIQINKSLSMLSRVISTLSGNIGGNIMGGVGGSVNGSGSLSNGGVSKRHSVGGMKQAEPSSRSQKKTSISPGGSPASSPQLSKAFNNHVPFRDSVLTWVLKDSLGGNSKTFMLATIASSSKYYPTTHNTLIYASHAKKIVNTVHVNQEKEMITSLKQEIEVLRKQLSLGGGDPTKLKEEIAQREAIIQELTKTLEEREAESKEIIEKIEEKHRKELIEKEKEFNNRMQTVIGSIMKEREELAGEMSEYKDMSVLSKGLEEQKNQIDKVHAEMRNFSAIITRIEATMKGMDEHEKARADNEKMKSDMEKLHFEVSEKSRELSRLNSELKVERDKFIDLEKKFIAITSERDHLTKSLAVVEARLSELISHQTTLTNDAIEKRIIEIEERYKREIEEMIEQFTLEKEKYVKQIQSQQMVIVGLESELKKIKE